MYWEFNTKGQGTIQKPVQSTITKIMDLEGEHCQR
jgi:hypothetical protein